MSNHFTTGQISEMYKVPVWQARRAIDALGETIPRAAMYRLVPASMLAKLEIELRRRGWLRTEEAVDA
jgi:hypothetical protein